MAGEVGEFISSFHITHKWMSFLFVVVRDGIDSSQQLVDVQLMLHLLEQVFVTFSKSYLFWLGIAFILLVIQGFCIVQTTYSRRCIIVSLHKLMYSVKQSTYLSISVLFLSVSSSTLKSVHSKQYLKGSVASDVHFLTVRFFFCRLSLHMGLVTCVQKNQVPVWSAKRW